MGKGYFCQVLQGLIQGLLPVGDRQDDRSLVRAFPLRTQLVETGLNPLAIRTPPAEVVAPSIKCSFGDTAKPLVRNAASITSN